MNKKLLSVCIALVVLVTGCGATNKQVNKNFWREFLSPFISFDYKWYFKLYGYYRKEFELNWIK